MPRTTAGPNDSENTSSSDDDTPTIKKQLVTYLTESEDESGSDADDESDEEHKDVLLITQDQAVWTIEELEVLCPFKEEWVESSTDHRGAIIDKAVKEVLALRKQDPGPLRKKIRSWLTRKVKKRKTYGPGKAPSLHTIVSWYKDVELAKLLKEKHGVVPGDKSRFIGLWKRELTAMVNDLRNDPENKKELKKMEDKRTRWMEKGPPPDRRKWAAEKKAMEMVKNFAYDIYWETGSRIVVTIAYRNTKNTVCVGQFDWNKYFGRNGKSFVDGHPDEAKAFVDKFEGYAEENLTGDEGDAIKDISEQKARTKLSKFKPDLTFKRNSRQEPILPDDCLDLKLEEKKHVFRCFLKSQYTIAKGAAGHGPRSSPPWAKLCESPDRFFSSDDVPEVEYDDGRRKVTLQDPSRMKNQELTACLRLWQDRQKEGALSFRFHHWWSEGQKEYIQASEPEAIETDAEDAGNVVENRKGTQMEKGKNKSEKRKDREKKRKRKQRSDPNQDKKAKETKNGPSVVPDYNLNISPLPELKMNVSFPMTSGLDNPESDNHRSSHGVEGIPFDPLSSNTLPHPATSLPIEIDPALTAFPTNGPNDHVPDGFHPVPYSMVPSGVRTDPIPGPSNITVPTIPSAIVPVPVPGTTLNPVNPGLVCTLDALAKMMLSLEARMTMQERQHHVPNSELRVQTTPIPAMELTLENRVPMQEGNDDPKGTGVNRDPNDQSTNGPKRGTKRKQYPSETAKCKRNDTKKMKIEEEGTNHFQEIKPRPLTRRVRKEVEEEDDHFRLRRSRRKRA